METTFATRDQAGAYRDRTLTAVFEREDEAERAIAALRAAGFADARIRLASGTGGEEAVATAPESFWEKLTDFFMPKEDEDLYAESLRRGLHLLTVTGIPVEGESLAISILDAEGAVDLEGHANAWRADGWSRETADYAPGGTAGMTGADSVPVTEELGHEPGGTAGMTGYSEPEETAREDRRTAQRDQALVGARVRAYDW